MGEEWKDVAYCEQMLQNVGQRLCRGDRDCEEVAVCEIERVERLQCVRQRVWRFRVCGRECGEVAECAAEGEESLQNVR